MSVSTLEPPHATSTLAADLVLARLLPPPPAKRYPTSQVVRTDVARLFSKPLADEPWQELIDRLVRDGFLQSVGRPRARSAHLELTDSGRARALRFLGVRALPAKCNWSQIRARFLVPKALGIPPESNEAQNCLKKEENLAALLLKRQLRLPGSASPSLGRIMEALVCKELGHPDLSSLKDLQRRLLSRTLDSETTLSQKELNKRVPRRLLGAKRGGLNGLRDLVLEGLADGAGPAAISPVSARSAKSAAADFDLPAFAATVKAAARHCPTGWFGDHLVFINHVYRQLREEPNVPSMDLAGFKRRLVEANNAGLLILSRADLVEVMDRADVVESATHYLNAEFHFVRVDKEHP